jgi:hypothetical protein
MYSGLQRVTEKSERPDSYAKRAAQKAYDHLKPQFEERSEIGVRNEPGSKKSSKRNSK